MKTINLLLHFLVTCVAVASIPFPRSYVVPGWPSESFLLMRPALEDGKSLGIGTCYRINEDGAFEKIWEIKGDYSFQNHLFLGENANILIRIVDVAQFQPDPDGTVLAEQPVLQFFRKGKLIKQFSVKDVVDPSRVQPTVFSAALSTHKIFGDDEAFQPKIATLSSFDYFDENDRDQINKKSGNGTQIFCVKTTQSEILVFKVADGSLIYRKKLG